MIAAPATELLESANEAGVKIVVRDGRIKQVCGMWWTQDIMDAIWEHELEIVALLTTAPPIFKLVRHVLEQLPAFLS